jgi:hypothetical protein
MAVYPTLGTGPVSFVDANFDQQELPLSQIFNSPNGWDVTTSPLYTTANQPVINALLLQLAAQGFVVAATQSLAASPSAPQAKVTAVQAGPMGNFITVRFANVSLSAGTFDVTVTSTQVFPNLTPSSVGSGITVSTALGNTVAAAVGLAYVSDAGDGFMPALYSGAAGVVNDTVTPIPGAAFTLAATVAAQAANITVNVAPGATTFTVTVVWSLTATSQTVADLLTANPFSYLVSFGGQNGPLPSGTVTLTGGANAAGANAAVAASASIYASS